MVTFLFTSESTTLVQKTQWEHLDKVLVDTVSPMSQIIKNLLIIWDIANYLGQRHDIKNLLYSIFDITDEVLGDATAWPEDTFSSEIKIFKVSSGFWYHLIIWDIG